MDYILKFINSVSLINDVKFWNRDYFWFIGQQISNPGFVLIDDY